MQVSPEVTVKDQVIYVRMGERLDCSMVNLFVEACRLAKLGENREIRVDLGRTRRVFFSGLALLLMLCQRAGRLEGHIKLVNCSPDIEEQLSACSLSPKFQIL
ncbi:MAG: STAS domain-containing protein [Pseudomonadota bacterium]|nr:STAS domain-containing protein [Pseudomonadota bacterium]